MFDIQDITLDYDRRAPESTHGAPHQVRIIANCTAGDAIAIHQATYLPETMIDTLRYCLGARDNNLPAVTDVHIVYDKHKDPDTGKKIKGGPKGVIVYFADGTKEKAICEDGDIPLFNLDFGITICLCKKLMGGSRAYNSKISDIYAMMEEKEVRKIKEREQKRLEGEARQEVKRAVAEAKRAAREAEIEIQKEAYLRAMKEYGGGTNLPDHN